MTEEKLQAYLNWEFFRNAPEIPIESIIMDISINKEKEKDLKKYFKVERPKHLKGAYVFSRR